MERAGGGGRGEEAPRSVVSALATTCHGHACDSLGYLLLGLKHGLLPYTIGETNFRLW
jgi:hypothetical protein